MKNHPAANPKNDGGEKESAKRHVYVEPGVKIDLVEDLKKKYESSETENAAHQKKQLLWVQISSVLIFIYAGLTAWQGCSTKRVVIEAQNANKIAIAANRPWIGQVEGDISDLIFIPRSETMDIQYIWRLRNSGHRPARLTAINTTGTWLNQCTMTPDFGEPKDANVPEGSEAGSRGIMLPDGKIISRFRESIPIEIWRQIIHGTLHYCVYIRIEYRDIDFPNLAHHTRDCEVLMPDAMVYAGCAIEYAYAD